MGPRGICVECRRKRYYAELDEDLRCLECRTNKKWHQRIEKTIDGRIKELEDTLKIVINEEYQVGGQYCDKHKKNMEFDPETRVWWCVLCHDNAITYHKLQELKNIKQKILEAE